MPNPQPPNTKHFEIGGNAWYVIDFVVYLCQRRFIKTFPGKLLFLFVKAGFKSQKSG